MSNLPGLVVGVEARIDKLEKGLKRANAAQKRSSVQMERRARQSANNIRNTYGKMGDGVAAGFKKMALPLFGGIASAAAVKGIAQTTKGIAQLGDEAKRAGVPLKDFQEWKFVAEQNRIGIDQMVDGLKELNLRADELILTGKGPAAEAFGRLGYTADELKTKLKNPSDLLLEIIGRLEDMDEAARIRISDEVFGGSAGERFVELVGRGEGAIRDTIRAAHDAGAVLDEELIRKADELDRRFGALQTRVANFGKTLAVEIADAGVKIATLRTDIDDLFRSYDQARGLLGDGVAETLAKDSDAVEEHKRDIQTLRAEYERLADYADGQSGGLLNAAALLRSYGYDDIANELVTAANEMRTLTSELEKGTISADEFEQRMADAATTAQNALGEIEAIDRADFANVIAGVGGLITRLAAAAAKARELRSALPGATPDGSTEGPKDYQGSGANPGNSYVGPTAVLPQAPKTSVRPQLPSVDASFGLPDVPTGGGGSGGGSGRSESDYQREIASIAEETQALRLEAQALNELTGAQKAHASVLELAETKADLLAAALRSGMADTPELRAQIDALAGEYVEAADAADLAADKIQEVQNASRAGAQSISNVFLDMATGAMTAKEAVGQLILELLKLEFQKRMLEIAESSTGWLSSLFTVLGGGGFAAGGYTGRGGKYEPAGVVHRGEYVMSAAATKAIGVGNLEALHQSARKGYSGGGLVGGATNGNSAPMGRSGGSGEAPMAITVNAPISIEGSAGTPEQNSDLAKKLAKSMEGVMRGTVTDELRRQMRPGALLNNGRRR